MRWHSGMVPQPKRIDEAELQQALEAVLLEMQDRGLDYDPNIGHNPEPVERAFLAAMQRVYGDWRRHSISGRWQPDIVCGACGEGLGNNGDGVRGRTGAVQRII